MFTGGMTAHQVQSLSGTPRWPTQVHGLQGLQSAGSAGLQTQLNCGPKVAAPPQQGYLMMGGMPCQGMQGMPFAMQSQHAAVAQPIQASQRQVVQQPQMLQQQQPHHVQRPAGKRPKEWCVHVDVEVVSGGPQLDAVKEDLVTEHAVASHIAQAVPQQAPVSQDGRLQSSTSKPPFPVVANAVAVVSGVEHIEPEAVQDLLRRRQCLLVDLRGDDRAAGLIEGAIHEPVQSFFNRVPQLANDWANEPLVIFTCQYSAHRAPQSANWYRSKADPRQRVAVLAGGFRGWESRGLPVKQFAPEITPHTAETVHAVAPQMASQAPQVAHTAATPPPKKVALPVVPNTVPTVSGVEHLEAETVFELLKQRACLLIDLRGDDRKSGLIDGAVHEPAIDTVPFPSKVPDLTRRWASQPIVVFTCQYSAHRAPQCANWYRAQANGGQRVGVLVGGFRGWEAQGFPVNNGGATTAAEVQAADALARQLGAQFVQKYVGFQLPKADEQASPQQAQAPATSALTIQSTPEAVQSVTTAAGLTTTTTTTVVAPKAKKVALPVVPNKVPTVAGVEHIDAEIVQGMMQQRHCLLVDLRGDDRASGLIDGATHEPAIDTVPFPTKVPDLVRRWKGESVVVFTCQYSAHRAPQCANWYRAQADPQQRVGILTGGFRGWEAQGLPVKSLATNAADARAADKFAKEQGAQFVQRYVGFQMPKPDA